MMEGNDENDFDETVEAGFVERMVLVLLHHACFHYVKRIAHACRDKAYFAPKMHGYRCK